MHGKVKVLSDWENFIIVITLEEIYGYLELDELYVKNLDLGFRRGSSFLMEKIKSKPDNFYVGEKIGNMNIVHNVKIY